MAQFEKGKGTRKRTVTINQLGTLLTKDEIDGVSQMLTGYRRHQTEESARAELIAEAATLIAEGLAPVDKIAKEIAALIPAKPIAKRQELPIRQDLYVYNEATGMMLTSKRMAGKTLDEGSSDWIKALSKGDILPMSLIQDDPFTVRVVVGGELEAAEQEEWVARVDWHLNIKDGKLCITGGAPLVSSDYQEDDSYIEQYVRELEIPKGHYRVSLYSYVPGINGCAVLDHLAGGYGKAEPLGRWFRRTRKEEEFPTWLKNLCIGDHSTDPGNEKQWQGLPFPDESTQPDYVHFLAHLTPVKAAPKDQLSKMPEDGWFGEAVNARLPKLCPLGLEGVNVIGHRQEAIRSWIFSHDAFKLVEGSKLTSVKGGAVLLPLNEVGLTFRIGWFASRMALSGIRVMPKDINQVDWLNEMPEGIVAAPNGKYVNFIFSNDFEPFVLLQKAVELESFLSKLPEGTVIETCSTLSDDYPGTDSEVARQRFQGVIKDGKWQVESCYPATDKNTLKEIFKLARESLAGLKITVADKPEGESILAWAKRNFHYQLEDNKVLLEGNSIKLKKSDKNLFVLVGAAAFAVRFGSVWKVVDLDDDEEDEDDWDDEDETSDGDPWDLKQPVKGAEVFRAPSGRIYYQTMAMLTSEKLSQLIQAEEPKLRASKFLHVADTICNLYPNTAVRGYAQKDGFTWAMLLVAAPDKIILELCSRFADGASIVTYRHMPAQDDLNRKIYKQAVMGAQIKELLEKHSARLIELEQKHGKPLAVVPTIVGLAEFREAELVKLLG